MLRLQLNIIKKTCSVLVCLNLAFVANCASLSQIDVLVIGGGASGTMATVQSARLGANTLLIEESSWLGGMLTSAGVSAIDGNNNLPSGLTGLLIAAIFAAGMSTISTSVNSSATVILNDYFKKSGSPAKTEKSKMRILYLSTLIFSILSILIALAMINVQSALDTWWKLASIFSGGMLGLFLLGYFSKKVNNTSAVIGVIAGVLVIGWMSLSPILFKSDALQRYANHFHSYLTIVFGTMTIFITGFLIGMITYKKVSR